MQAWGALGRIGIVMAACSEVGAGLRGRRGRGVASEEARQRLVRGPRLRGFVSACKRARAPRAWRGEEMAGMAKAAINSMIQLWLERAWFQPVCPRPSACASSRCSTVETHAARVCCVRRIRHPVARLILLPRSRKGQLVRRPDSGGRQESSRITSSRKAS